jgi:hypothetical protein
MNGDNGNEDGEVPIPEIGSSIYRPRKVEFVVIITREWG